MLLEAHVHYLTVVNTVPQYLMTVRFQQISFGHQAFVPATGSLVLTMNYKILYVTMGSGRLDPSDRSSYEDS